MESSLDLTKKKALIDKNSKLSIARQCKLLGISRSTVYYKPTPPSEDEIRIKNAIDRIYTAHPCYGTRRIRKELEDYGIFIGRSRVRRYMREMDIDAIYPGPNLSKRNKLHHTYPYLLRNVNIDHANQVWGIDLSYIGTSHGWMYLVVIIDWYTRFVVGWGLSNTLHIEFVLEAVKRAIARYGKPEIINSDQGCHFTCKDYIELLKSNEIIISMNGKGRATDNAITERFLRSLKHEKLYLEELHNGREAFRAIDAYIVEYNWQRRHQSLGGKTPASLFFQHSYAVEAV